MEEKLVPFSPALLPVGASVLVLAPHPDDEVFGCGGATRLHLNAGCQVQAVVMTDGQVRGDAQVRRQESIAAALALGCEAPQFWGLPDQGVLYGEALVLRILSAIEARKVDVLYAPSLWENHPDHRAVALAAREAVRRHGHTILMAYEIGAALRPNCLIDITSVREHKQAAMRCFVSQLALQAYDRHINALNTYRTYTLSATVQAAEAFERTDAAALRAGTQSFLESEYQRQREAGLILLPEDTDFVSVLIRSMDRPELDRALSSIAVQTWPRIEVVVVNAKGSGHRPLSEWCGRFPLRFIDSEQALQRSAAANRALSHARGDSLIFLDDDDWLDPDHVSKLTRALSARPDAAAAVTGVQGVDADGQRVALWRGDAGIQRLMLANQMPIMSVMFRHDRLKDARFDEDLDVFEDWDFWLQIAQTGPFVVAPGVSASYLIRPFDGSGVHQKSVAELGTAKLRKKWHNRWPQAWYGALMQELQGLDSRVAGQLEQLTQSQAQLEQSHAQLDQSQAALRTLEQRSLQAEHQVSVLQQSLGHSQVAQRVAEQHSATMEHLRNIAEQQRVHAEGARGVADQQLQTALQKNSDLAAQLELVRHESVTLRHQLQAVHASRSWWVTAPLRWATDMLRKFR